MIETSDRLYASFIGPNWTSHYRGAFGRIEGSGQRGGWNTAAAVVPFWFVYRGLTSWSIIFFLSVLVLYAVYATVFTFFSWMRHELFWWPLVPAYLTASIAQGLVADKLLYKLALRKINQVRRSASNQATAVRELSALAPKAPPGAYITHTVLMLIGVPIWSVGVWSGATALRPSYSEPQSVYVALLRTALRDLIVTQETFFLEAAQYSDDIARLRYVPPEGVIIRLTSASDSGWAATASHAMVAASCTIFMGRGTSAEPANEGIAVCP